jgi:hypothetical protein
MSFELERFVAIVNQTAEQITGSGINGYTRFQTANMIGINKMVAFDKRQTRTFALALWMLSTLKEKQLQQHYDFICKTVMRTPVVPGEIDKDHHEEVVRIIKEEIRSNEEMAEKTIRFMIQGESLESQGITGAKKQNVTAKIQVVTFRLKQTIGEIPGITNFVDALGSKLEIVNPEMMLALITQSAPSRINARNAWLTPHEVSLCQIAASMPGSHFKALELFYDQSLERIEAFRHEHFTLIRKVYPVLMGEQPGKDAPYAAKFFDHDEKAKAPSIDELAKLSSMVDEYDSLQPGLFREKLDEHYGDNKRIRYSALGRAKQLLDSGQVASMYEAHERADKSMDKGQFYRLYKNWELKSKFKPYWRKHGK